MLKYNVERRNREEYKIKKKKQNGKEFESSKKI